MLGSADDVAQSLGTSTSLGAHDPGLPASSVFFQHPKQPDALAVAVASVSAGKNRADLSCAGTVRADFPGAEFAGATDTISGTRGVLLACTRQGFAAIRRLVLRVRGKH